MARSAAPNEGCQLLCVQHLVHSTVDMPWQTLPCIATYTNMGCSSTPPGVTTCYHRVVVCTAHGMPHSMTAGLPHKLRVGQGSQAPLEVFDQRVEGPWPITTSCPPGGLWGRASAFWRENRSKCQPFRAKKFDQPVEDPSTFSEISGLRPVKFDPSTSLRALAWESCQDVTSGVCRGVFICFTCIHSP
jgi:hypothetical protein